MNAVEMYVVLDRIAGGRLAMPVVAWIPGPSHGMAAAYLTLAIVAGIAITLGCQVTFAASISTVLSATVFLWDQQTYSNHRWLALLLVACLIFARSDNAWSLARPAKNEPVPWWPQLLMMSQLSVCYFFAAASKVNGSFLSGAPLSSWIWVPLPIWIFTVMAFATVIVEGFIAFALWGHRTRRVAIALGVGLHLSIVVMMNHQTWALIAFTLTCVSLYGLFLCRFDAATPDRSLDETPAPVRSGRADG